MSWKKNTFSYLLWVLYAVAVEVGLVCMADAVCDSLGAEIYIGTAACALYIVLAGAGVFLIHRFAPKYSDAGRKNHSLWAVILGTLALALLTAGFILRVRGAVGAEVNSVYYELAAVGPERELSEGIHGAVYFYVQLLHGLLYFLGNKPVVAVWMQILLQMGALLLFYLAVRKLTGGMAALVTLAFCMFSSYLIRESFRLSPAMLYLLFWSAVLLVIVSAVQPGIRLWCYPAVGILIALPSWLDAAGLLLLLIFVVLMAGGEQKPGRRSKALLFCFAGAAAGFAGCALADSLVSGKTFLRTLAAWGRLYGPGNFRLPVTTDTPEILVEYIILFCVLTLGMFSFWRDRRRDYGKGWILLLLFWGTAGCFKALTEEMPMGIYIYLLLAVMAGITVKECVCLRQPVPAEGSPGGEAAEAEEQSGGEAAEIPAEQAPEKSRRKPAGQAPEKNRQKPAGHVPEKSRRKPAERVSEREETKTGGRQEMAAKEVEAGTIQEAAGKEAGAGKALPSKEIHFIENPLPLPKKHVKRTLDYGREVPEGKYDFDLEVDEKDDFDI